VLARDPLANPEPLIRRVYAYAAYRVGAGPDAEDVTSDTFERALRYKSSFDPRRGDPAAWLVGIARRCADELLSRRLDLASDPPEAASPTDFPSNSLLQMELREALRALDPRDRELVALRFGADLTARQIGEILGLRTNAVEVALHRALGRLRRELEPDAAAPELRPVRV
jgi:RNA polymerase sigma-70 factor (ECF subfamily)